MPVTELDRERIEEQLERILTHPTFKNSVRCPKFLRYVVGYGLQNSGAPLKERILGMEVFGRRADYDTDQDTIVRATAGDVRRRIAQYYHEPGHENEIRIDLPAGSYLPEFHIPLGEVAQEGAFVTLPGMASKASRRWIWAVASLLIVLLVLAGALIWHDYRGKEAGGESTANSTAGQEQAIDVFWKPLLDRSAPLLICDGEPPRTTIHTRFADAEADTLVTNLLIRKAYEFELKTVDHTTPEDLRQKVPILIGGFVNPLGQKKADTLRFHLAGRPGEGSIWIEDRKDPTSRKFSRTSTMPSGEFRKDYAIIARYQDTETGHWTLVVAGLGEAGTLAAAELVTNVRFMEELSRRAPAEWGALDLEAVISTEITNGKPGPPVLEAVEVW
jgi:hypothetical protein